MNWCTEHEICILPYYELNKDPEIPKVWVGRARGSIRFCNSCVSQYVYLAHRWITHCVSACIVIFNVLPGAVLVATWCLLCNLRGLFLWGHFLGGLFLWGWVCGMVGQYLLENVHLLVGNAAGLHVYLEVRQGTREAVQGPKVVADTTKNLHSPRESSLECLRCCCPLLPPLHFE